MHVRLDLRRPYCMFMWAIRDRDDDDADAGVGDGCGVCLQLVRQHTHTNNGSRLHGTCMGTHKTRGRFETDAERELIGVCTLAGLITY